MYKKTAFLLIFFLFMICASGCNLSKVDVNTLNEKAVGYMQNGDYDKAIERLNSINDLDPSYPATYYNLGVAYYKKGDYIKSLENLQKSISLDKNLKDAYYTSAVVYEEIGSALFDKDESGDDKKNSDLKCYENFLSDKKSDLDVGSLKEYNETIKCYGFAISNYEKYLSLNNDGKENEKVKDQIEFLKEEINKVNSGTSSSDGEE